MSKCLTHLHRSPRLYRPVMLDFAFIAFAMTGVHQPALERIGASGIVARQCTQSRLNRYSPSSLWVLEPCVTEALPMARHRRNSRRTIGSAGPGRTRVLPAPMSAHAAALSRLRRVPRSAGFCGTPAAPSASCHAPSWPTAEKGVYVVIRQLLAEGRTYGSCLCLPLARPPLPAGRGEGEGRARLMSLRVNRVDQRASTCAVGQLQKADCSCSNAREVVEP